MSLPLANRQSKIDNRKFLRGCSSMVERQLPKLDTRVRFPSPALPPKGPGDLLPRRGRNDSAGLNLPRKVNLPNRLSETPQRDKTNEFLQCEAHKDGLEHKSISSGGGMAT
jgi:hypothetical protein